MRRTVDGDTLLLTTGERVRLLGIDTPELKAANAQARSLAQVAKRELETRVGGQRVMLLCQGQDRYDRTLAYVHLEGESPEDEQADINRLLVRRGHARLYPTAHPRQALYAEAQAAAQREGRGIWTPAGRRATGWGLPAEAEIPAREARLHEGRRVTVIGRVDHTHRSKKALFVNFSSDWKQGFTAVIFASQLASFPTNIAEDWKGRRLAVTGKVKIYKGGPEIVVKSPDQVELLD